MRKIALLLVMWNGVSGCSKNSAPPIPVQVDSASERSARSGSAVSPESVALATGVRAGRISVTGKARFGMLYYLDRPAHRELALKTLRDAGAKILYDNPRFGYVDAELSWEKIGDLIEGIDAVGISSSPSIFKLELENVQVAAADGGTSKEKTGKPKTAPDGSPRNTLYRGPVHSAGYGSKVREFRELFAKEQGIAVDEIAGQGSVIAVFDGGIDLRHTDVTGDRIVDILVGEENEWITASVTPADFLKKENKTELPEELKALQENATLRFLELKEGPSGDFNGNSVFDESLSVAVFEKDGEMQARVRPSAGVAFGETARDFSSSRKKGLPPLINLHTGGIYQYTPLSPKAIVAAFKFRKDPNPEAGGAIQVAFFGMNGPHGIANLQMAGGDFDAGANPLTGEKTSFQGVAPKVGFLAMDTWPEGSNTYGSTWVPLARSILLAAEANADVIDLDIYTPGTRNADDMLSKLACRVTALTKSVPVVAAHNYGPLPNTVQSMAQSPCVLGIGAADSAASYRVGGRNAGSIDPALAAGAEDELQTTTYSGRGFGLNGLLKPDVITPAYAYTAYGEEFVRFGGTSGATPTTAGIIALLKQAARMKGVELGFPEVRFLLQGGTRPVRDGLHRDGYGFTDLARTWELFKKVYVPGQSSIRAFPFSLSGQQVMQFTDRPQNKTTTLMLHREVIPGDVRAPIPMKFWVEYGGASVDADKTDQKWLKFYDRSESGLKEELEWDAPIPNNEEPLRIAFDLSDEAWAKLPVGDHIALIKGVRTGLGPLGGREVDFIQPISFTKAIESFEEKVDLGALYEDQYRTLPIRTKKGERIFLYGEVKCLGQTVPTFIPTSPMNTGLDVLIEHETAYPHASDVMNSYQNLNLGYGPIRVIAKGSLIRVSVLRYSEAGCAGAMTGAVTIRRVGFGFTPLSSRMTRSTSTISIEGEGALTVLSGVFQRPEIGGATAWETKADTYDLVFRKTVNAETDVALPSLSLDEARVIPLKKSFQGVLASLNAKGELEAQAKPELQPYYSGLESGSLYLNGDYTGLFLKKLPASGSLLYRPAVSSKTHTGAAALLELYHRSLSGRDGKLAIEVVQFTSWLAGSEKKLQYKMELPRKLTETYPFLAEKGWSAELVVPVKIIEKMSVGQAHAEALELEVGGFEIRSVLPID